MISKNFRMLALAMIIAVPMTSCSHDGNDEMEVVKPNYASTKGEVSAAPVYHEAQVMVNSNIVSTNPAVAVNTEVLKVTVKSIEVKVGADDDTYYLTPEPVAKVAEPTYSSKWTSLPAGLDVQQQPVIKQNLVIKYKRYFDAYAKVTCVVRVKDDNLAKGYTQHPETFTYSCSSYNLNGSLGEINCPVYVTPVNFDADVTEYTPVEFNVSVTDYTE